MRQKRAKTYKRVMALYTGTFGFRTPFQVLVSHDVLIEGSKSDLNMPKQFLSVLQSECKLMITQCCMEALYKLGKDVQKTTDLAKRFERRKCNHRTALEADECLKDVIGQTNKHRYILATQSTALISSLQPVPGLPIIHFNPRSVMVLSPPSTATVREKNRVEEGRRLEGLKVLDGLDDGVNVVGAKQAGPVAEGDKRARKVKGVNPLSQKKKKTLPPPPAGAKRPRSDDEAEAEEGGEGDSKRKRKRKKKKSAVGEAIEELNASNAAAPEGTQLGEAGSDGESDGGSDDE